MKERILTVVLLTILIWPAGLALGQVEAPDRDGFRWGVAAGLSADHPASDDAIEKWAPPHRVGPGATITVTTTNDELNGDGDCSLREAIEAANIDAAVDACVPGSGDDTVVTPAGAYILSIPGTGEDGNQTGDLDILDNLVIRGDGAEITVIDGGALDRIFQVHIGRTVEIDDLTVANGHVHAEHGGGGILNQGALRLNGVTLRDNLVTTDPGWNVGGGALSNDAYYANAEAVLDDCLLTGNRAWSGGAIDSAANSDFTATLVLNETIVCDNAAENAGGGIWSTYFIGATSARTTTTLSNSVVERNLAVGEGGGIAAYGAEGAENTLQIDQCTIRSNVVAGSDPYTGRGGGLWVSASALRLSACTVSDNIAESAGLAAGHGGGMFILDSPAEVVNSTISGNWVIGSGLADVSGLGGGIIVVGEVDPASLTLTNTTVAGNSSNVGGGGIANAFFGADATTTFKNSLVSGNSAPPDLGPSCYNTDQFGGQGTLDSLGHNLEDYDTCEFHQPGDMINTDPLLGPLGGYGGPTETHLLLTGSPAVDAGDDGAAPDTDQRGVPRPQGPASDIGAYEAVAIYAAGIKLRVRDAGGGRYIVLAMSRILTQARECLPNGEVQVAWTLPSGMIREKWATTNDRGVARFAIGTRQSGTFEFCVTDVVKDGYTYDPTLGMEPCRTVEVP